MIILVGESASGKSTIQKVLVEKYNFHKTPSYTTRPKRENEVDGIDYCFVSDEEFDKKKRSGFFVETASYRGWKYGTPQEVISQESVVILTPRGFRSLKYYLYETDKDKFNTAVSFYLNVPRRDRLLKLLERGDDIEEAYRRSLSDVGQFDGIEDEVDFVVDNSSYNKAPVDLADEINRCYQRYCFRQEEKDD